MTWREIADELAEALREIVDPNDGWQVGLAETPLRHYDDKVTETLGVEEL